MQFILQFSHGFKSRVGLSTMFRFNCTTVIILYVLMTRIRVKGSKYNRVSQQQKFILLHSVLKENMTIGQAATRAEVHYSTAKTILFFHKHKQKVYFRHKIERTDSNSENQMVQAGYIEKKHLLAYMKIPVLQVISTVNCSDTSCFKPLAQKKQYRHIISPKSKNGAELIIDNQNKCSVEIKQVTPTNTFERRKAGKMKNFIDEVDAQHPKDGQVSNMFEMAESGMEAEEEVREDMTPYKSTAQ